MNQKNIGFLIKQLRLSKNLTQKQLGEELHVTEQAISKWENGRGLPDTDTIFNLCKFFDITMDDFSKGVCENNYNKEEEISESKIFIAIRCIIYALLISFFSIVVLNYAFQWGLV